MLGQQTIDPFEEVQFSEINRYSFITALLFAGCADGDWSLVPFFSNIDVHCTHFSTFSDHGGLPFPQLL